MDKTSPTFHLSLFEKSLIGNREDYQTPPTHKQTHTHFKGVNVYHQITHGSIILELNQQSFKARKGEDRANRFSVSSHVVIVEVSASRGELL